MEPRFEQRGGIDEHGARVRLRKRKRPGARAMKRPFAIPYVIGYSRKRSSPAARCARRQKGLAGLPGHTGRDHAEDRMNSLAIRIPLPYDPFVPILIGVAVLAVIGLIAAWRTERWDSTKRMSPEYAEQFKRELRNSIVGFVAVILLAALALTYT